MVPPTTTKSASSFVVSDFRNLWLSKIHFYFPNNTPPCKGYAINYVTGWITLNLIYIIRYGFVWFKMIWTMYRSFYVTFTILKLINVLIKCNYHKQFHPLLDTSTFTSAPCIYVEDSLAILLHLLITSSTCKL